MPSPVPSPALVLVTAHACRARDADLPPLLAALGALGVCCEVAQWDDPAVDWARFDAALVRSTWDYSWRLPEFLAWVRRAGAATRLLNPAPVLEWNTDKHYLADLAREGVPVVPSEFIEPGADATAALSGFLADHSAAELVIKPAVGAGTRDTRRFERQDTAAMLAHARALLAAGRSVLVQPYLERVEACGETALVYFDGVFSHAVRKPPLLPRAGQAAAAERIAPCAPTPAELELAQRTLAAVRFGRLPYARVDLLRDGADAPCLLELELTEPSLFLDHAAGSAERFARGLLSWLDGG